MARNELAIIDSHTHFFSYTWLDYFYQAARERFGSIEEVANHLRWEVPPADPVELGRRWLAEQDRYQVAKQVLFASKLNDAEFLAAAVREYPDRLLGYVMIDPTQESARNQAMYAFNILDMSGVLLFPAMHHFRADDACACTIYEEAVAASAPVFIHFGQLRIPIYEKLGLPENVDLSYSNPLDLGHVLGDFPEATFIIPHFGCGRFEEALQLVDKFQNVYFDSSSSNSWIREPHSLRDVFMRAVEVAGPERILFGTDSSFFPRGWRKDIFDQQLEIVRNIGLSLPDQRLIFGENIARILSLD